MQQAHGVDTRARRALYCVLLLCLARVDAQCTPCYYALPPTNLALGKFVATAGGDLDTNSVGQKAIDQCTATTYGCYWHSANPSTTAWLGVDLGASTFVSTVRYYFYPTAYSDTYTLRVGNNANYVGNYACSTIYINTAVDLYRDMTCSSTGRYVSLHKNSNGYMCVIEFQIFSLQGGCTECPTGQYKAISGTQACSACPSNSWTTTTASTQCSCNAGYTGNFDSCTGCISGTYKSTTGSDACINCGPYLISSAAATQCLCNAGYSGPANGPCTLCSGNSIKPYSGDAACLTCVEPRLANTAKTLYFRTVGRSVQCLSSWKI